MVQLGRGDTEIEDDPIEGGTVCSELGHVTKAATPSLEALSNSSQPAACGLEGRWVSVDAQYLALSAEEEGLRVAPAAQRAIQV